MAIVGDYAGIAVELRRIQAERSPQEPCKRRPPIGGDVTSRGEVHVDIRFDPPLKRLPVLARRGWTAD